MTLIHAQQRPVITEHRLRGKEIAFLVPVEQLVHME